MRPALIILILVLMSAPAAAQNERICGNGLPCGNIPWDLPVFPALPSPTHIPTVAFTATPTPTQTPGTPTATPTPTATYTPSITPTSMLGELNQGIGTLSAGFDGTPSAIDDLRGTPVSLGDEADAITDNATIFFGYVKGMSDLNFGKITPIIVFTTFVLIIVVSTKAITFLLPIMSVILSYIVRMVAFIVEMIIKAVRVGITGGA